MELLIVCAIIGIMTAVVLTNMGNQRAARDVENAAREVAAAVREAQNYALTGKSASSFCQQYNFAYGAPSGDYSVTVGPSGPPNCPAPIAYSLKNNVVFGNVDSFYFTIPHGEIYEGPGDRLEGAEKITITVSKDGNTKNVCVYPSGRVEERNSGC